MSCSYSYIYYTVLWYSSIFTVDCAPLSDPTGGTIVYSTGALTNTNYPTGTVADYSCTPPGELFDGDATRHCLSGGTWSGREPICSSKFVKLSSCQVQPVIISMEPLRLNL